MGTTTPLMSLQRPTLGGDPGTWDDQIAASFDLIDAHDHTTGKGTKVPTAGLNINADLTFGGYAATNVKAISFTAQASYSTNRSLFVKTSDNELYWRTNAGAEVKVTSGSSLNLSLVGGLYGDYSTTDAQLYYDAASTTYRFLSDDSPSTWASAGVGDLLLYQKAASISNAVTLKSPNSLAASYSVTFPGAVPGSTSLVQMTTGGVLQYNATGAKAAFLGVSGEVEFIGTTSKITLTTDVADTTPAIAISKSEGGVAIDCGSDADIELSGTGSVILGGTGRYKHGDFTLTIPAAAMVDAGLGGTLSYSSGGWTMTTATAQLDAPICLPVGKRLKSCTVYFTSDGSGSVQLQLYKTTSAAAAAAVGSSSADLDTGGAGPASGSLDFTDSTIAAGESYFIRIAADGGPVIKSLDVIYDEP